MIMRIFVLLLLMVKTFMVFAQTQHINQLIENVLPDFISSYNNKHNTDFSIVENGFPYLAANAMKMKKCKYVEGRINGGLKNGNHCNFPSLYLISKDTLSMQIFLCSASKRFGLKIGDTVNFYFVYSKRSGLWEYIVNFTSHATWYRDGKFIGDFVKECMEECYHELQKEDGIFHHNVYVIDDYLTLFAINDSILSNLTHIPKGHNKKQYCKKNDWLIGFPEISFHRDTIAVSSKAFMAKDYKSDFNIREYLQCTLYYQYNSETHTWDNCKKETEIIKKH